MADSLITECAEIVSCQIATTKDARNLRELYERLTHLPLKALYEIPLPLLQEFWKWLTSQADKAPNVKSLKTMAVLVDGMCALLLKEDQHQVDVRGVDQQDLDADYVAMIQDIAHAIKAEDQTVAEWAINVFRVPRRRLQNREEVFEEDFPTDYSTTDEACD